MKQRQQAIRVQSKINGLDQKVKEWLLLNLAHQDNPSPELLAKKNLVEDITSDLFDELKTRLASDSESYDRLLNLELEWKKINVNFPGHNVLEYFSFETKQLEKAQLDKIGVHGPLIDNDFRWIYVMSTVLLILSSFVITAALVLFRREQRLNSQLIDELRVSKDEAQASSRLKSQILATVSHEIRTPLNGIIGMCEILISQNDFEDTVKKKIQVILASGKTLNHIINDILDFSKVEAGKISTNNSAFNLQRVCQNVIESLSFQANQKGIALQLDYEESLPVNFEGDKDLISQILYNLVGNAVKFTQIGYVNLSVTKSSGGKVQMIITDTGIGIEKESISRVFEPFFQAKNVSTEKGTGLGLAICKRLIELMNGRIKVTSKINSGTQFTVQIPLVESKTQLIHGGKSSQSTGPYTLPKFHNIHALIVEDNSTNQLIITKMLELLNISYDVTNNGQEAVDKVATGEYNCVFMDCQMPVMDGYEATRVLRKNSFKATIFAMTANAADENRDECIAAGMDDFISKPIGIEDLAQTLSEYFKNHILPEERLGEKKEKLNALAQNLIGDKEREVLNDVDFINIENHMKDQFKRLSNETNDEVATQIVLSFQTSLVAALMDLENNHDLIELKKIAHKYKASSKMLGLDLFVRICKKIEDSQSLEEAQGHAEDLKKMIPCVQETLEKIV